MVKNAEGFFCKVSPLFPKRNLFRRYTLRNVQNVGYIFDNLLDKENKVLGVNWLDISIWQKNVDFLISCS